MRKPNFIRFGRADPWSETRPNFLRFGRSRDTHQPEQFFRLTRNSEDDRRPNFIRFGKSGKPDPFEMSDRKPNIIRFGRSVNPKFQQYERKESIEAPAKGFAA
ncbi:unnamed protein product [Soboliphyme baturini]|uniref:FMRFamide-related peptides n=1 Tax=Soboliphyme baturini TaxID=241478 RepID=A0A183JAM8_9BILA|nr:unnamed protein product [Soboliphyme baturini]